MIGLLPKADAVLFFADVRAFREIGLLAKLAGSKAIEDTDYRQFLNETHFDYQKDIDAIAAASLPGQLFAVVRGNFDWQRLSKHASQHGGSCHNSYCQLPASQPNRWISFFPLRSDVMGLAISSDPSAAYMLLPRRGTPTVAIPAYSAWISLPQRTLADASSLPPAARLFAAALSAASRTVLGLEGRPDTANHLRMDLRLDAQCDTPERAKQVENRLKELTGVVASILGRDHQAPRAGDLSGLLAAGTFARAGTVVKGTWPLRQEFLNSLLQ